MCEVFARPDAHKCVFYSLLWGRGNESARKNIWIDRRLGRKNSGRWSVDPVRGEMKWELARMTRKPTTTRDEAPAEARASALSGPRFALRSRARLHLLPPNDEFQVVVASAARAVCADRATSRGSPRRSIRVQLPSSCIPHVISLLGDQVSTPRSRRGCRGGETFNSPAAPQYSEVSGGIRIQL